LLSFLLLFSVCRAESARYFVVRWNSFAQHFNGVQLSEESAKEAGNTLAFFGDTWNLVLIRKDEKYISAAVYADDFETLMSNCTTMGLVLVGDAENFTTFLGAIAWQYLALKSGEKPIPSVYGAYIFNISKRNKGYTITFSEF